MAGKTASGARQQAAATSLYATAIPTTSEYVDVSFVDDRGEVITEITSDFAISLVVEGAAATQAVNVQILQRAHRSATWRTLQAETSVATSGITEVYADIVRAAQIKVQIKEGTSGGVGTLALCLK